MNGPFEKYAGQATQAFCIARWGETATGLADADDVEFYREGVAAAVEAVGPLIVEDTRERIVAAAAAAVEREGAADPIVAAARKEFAEEIVGVLDRYFPDPHEEGEDCEDCAVLHDLARIITERGAQP